MPNLETVTLPAGLTSIPKDAFANSAKLKTVNFKAADASNGGVQRETTPGTLDFSGAKALTSIGTNAFTSIAATTVDLSGVIGLTTINDYVFKDMASLTEVKLPSSINQINNGAFQNDAALKKLSQDNPSAQARDESPAPADTATFGSKLTSIQQNAFQGTGFTTVDLSKAVGTPASGSSGTQTTPLSVGSNAFTNMANLETVKLPKDSNINLAYFGNPATEGTEQKLKTITYGADATSTLATITLSDATISSTNFSKITNKEIQIKSSTNQTINFSGGVFNGNETMTTLKLSVTQNPANNNASL